MVKPFLFFLFFLMHLLHCVCFFATIDPDNIAKAANLRSYFPIGKSESIVAGTRVPHHGITELGEKKRNRLQKGTIHLMCNKVIFETVYFTNNSLAV